MSIKFEDKEIAERYFEGKQIQQVSFEDKLIYSKAFCTFLETVKDKMPQTEVLKTSYEAVRNYVKRNADTILIPGVAEKGRLFGFKTDTGETVNFDFSRESTATLFDGYKDLNLADAGMPRIDFGNYSENAKILIEKESANLFVDSTFELDLNSLKSNATIENANWLNFISKKAVITHTSTVNGHYYKRYMFPNALDVYTLSSFLYSEGNLPTLNVIAERSIGSFIGNGFLSVSPKKISLVKDNIWKVFMGIRPVSTDLGKLATLGYVQYVGQSQQLLAVAAYQLELGTQCTSYIPTTTTSSTRAADLLTYDLTNDCSVYLKTTREEVILDKQAGLWNIHDDMDNDGIECLAIFKKTLSENEKNNLLHSA